MVAYSIFLLPILLFVGQAIGAPPSYTAACKAVEVAIGKSNVFYQGSTDYTSDVYHNFGSSAESAACSVDPGTTADVTKVLRVIALMKVPFAVKSGGHAFARTFSSTQGIQIDLSKFDKIEYDAASQTVAIGPGQTWNTVYTALEKFGVTCIGARLPSVGVGGFLLGGGYGWLSNQLGLGIDNILAYELVLPTGEVVEVTEAARPDLFFALKGGLNNFGIVTKFTIKTFPQGTIWGGTLSFASKDVPAVTNAFAKFAEGTDPKASLASYFFGAVGSTDVTSLALIFYDAPSPPPGLYDELLAIPTVAADVKTRSLLSLVQASGGFPYTRGLVEQVPVMHFPVPLLEEFQSEAVLMADTMKNAKPVWIGYLIEPFAPSLLLQAPPSNPSFPTSAWPPTRDFAVTTSAIWLGWNESSQDTIIQDAARASSARIAAKAASLGQPQALPSFPDTSIYPNYAATWTTAKQLYGSHLPLLQTIKKQYDPNNIMGLAGGVKITPA